MHATRRGVLGGAALAALSFPTRGFAQDAAEKRLLVVILRGGMDGLAAAPATGDPDYARLRGRLAIDGALPLDARFGLHPNLRKLHAMYGAGELLCIHAAATGYRDRSHFDAQNMLETGGAAPFARTEGWLNKALAALPGAGRRELGVAMAAQTPLVLRGDAPVTNWSPSALPDVQPDTVTRLMDLYGRRDPALAAALQSAIAANDLAAGAGEMGGRGGARQLASLARVAATFLKQPDGPVAAVLEMGNWDTHANQGLAQGVLARNFALLDDGLDTFKAEMGPLWRSTVVVVATEFGRTVAPNGAQGTDHGTASAAFLIGGAVAGGRVLADWPGLSEGALYQRRDLAPTTDLRAVLKGVLGDHLALTHAALTRDVFPGAESARPIQGLIRA